MIVVPDAGPLIYLAGAGHLELLPQLYDRVVVPRVVLDEIVVAGAGLTGSREVAAAEWLKGRRPCPTPSSFGHWIGAKLQRFRWPSDLARISCATTRLDAPRPGAEVYR